jgi:hypothetical protein
MPDEPTTENDVLGSIPGIDDDAPTDNTESIEQSTPTTETASDTETQQTTDSETSSGSDTGEQRARTSGSPQDLLDAQGNVVARAGAERRHYETAQRLRNETQQLTTRNRELTARLDALEGANTLGTQYGLSADELTAGAQLMKSWKEDPAGTVKYMLTQAQAMGHNVADGGTDVRAIKSMIDEALAPIRGRYESEQQQEQTRQEAQQVYNNFMASYPDAAVHQNALAQLLDNEPSLSLEAAYFKLKSAFAERGLDWNVNLETHLANSQRQQGQQEIPPNRGGQQQPLPSGSVNSGAVTDTAEIASADASFDDIIKQSMSEAGMNYS